MKTYKFYIIFDPFFVDAKNLQSALKQLKRRVGKNYYYLIGVYLCNDQVRHLKQEFMDSLYEEGLALARSAAGGIK